MKYTRWFFSILLITSFLLSGFTQQAQNAVQIEKLQVNIWPEYDRPATLVIYRITLSSDTKLPAQISLRIPRAAGSPYNVAIKDLDGLLYDLEYTLIPEGDWNRVAFITASAELQVEYYDPNTQLSGNTHTINYRWIGDYPVGDLNMIVQQPKDAYNLTISPSLGLGNVNPDDGLTYFNRYLGAVDAGTAFDVTVTFQKDTNSLSATLIPVKPSGQLPIKRSFADQLKALVLPIVQNRGLVVVGLLILGWLVIFLLAISLSGSSIFKRMKLKLSPAAPATDSKEEDDSQIYCYQCGKKAHPGDVFCRACGAKLQLP